MAYPFTWDDWYVEGEHADGVLLYCPHPDCEWTYSHPYRGASIGALSFLAEAHHREAHDGR